MRSQSIRSAIPLLLLASILTAAPGRAAGEHAAHRLRFDSATTVPLTVGAATLWIASEFPFKGALSPDSCRWCDRGADGRDKLNRLDASMRERLRWEHPDAARRASDVLLFVGVPAVAIGSTWLAARHDDREDEFGEDARIIFEAFAVSTMLNQVTKFTLGRQRPYLHFAGEAGARRRPDSDDNLSFYSGHAAATFTLATAAGTVASLRGYRGSHWVWIPGVALATATSYLRIACDRHYFTDVLAGMVIGSAVGIGLPRILHGRRDNPVDGTSPSLSSPVAPAFVLRWTW